MNFNENAVEVINLTKQFGKFTAVNSISFSVKRGTVFGFLGANGAGKTTAIRMLCGLIPPTSGDAFVDGLSVTKSPFKIKGRIGYMSQKFSLYDDLTVWENVSFFSGLYRVSNAILKEIGLDTLKRLDLFEKRNMMTGSLPLGFKQRLALGVSLLHSPAVLFLDEPTAGVDPIARRNFWDILYEIAEGGTTIFVTTHFMDEAEYCDTILMLKDGAIIANGTPKDLKQLHTAKNMQQLFITLAK